MGSTIIRGVIVRVDGQLVSERLGSSAREKFSGPGSEGDCGELPERLGRLGLRYGEVGGFDAAAPEGAKRQVARLDGKGQ